MKTVRVSVPRLLRAALLASAAVVAALALPAAAAAAPRGFFGIGPQTPLTAKDTSRMRQGGVGAVRIPVVWSSIDPNPQPVYDWRGLDEVVALTARERLDLLPFVYGTPHWVAGKPTALPVSSGRQRRAWAQFLRAAAERYGSHGEFWLEHSRESGDFVPKRPVTTWQIWNEPNFFYFATPASPGRYGRLLKASRSALRQGDPRAKIITAGLFGNPKERPPRAMDADEFLDRLYRVPGVKASFDGVALHPYAADTGVLGELVERLRAVSVRHHDSRTGLYVTEMGWGSQRDPGRVAFEVGPREQAHELTDAFRYLLRNRHRLNVKQAYWFSWKDIAGDCNFCDSVGLFRRGARFRPKPAWHAFVRVAR
jgi:hypothetical protein